jgi:hypothetical protein
MKQHPFVPAIPTIAFRHEQLDRRAGHRKLYGSWLSAVARMAQIRYGWCGAVRRWWCAGH